MSEKHIVIIGGGPAGYEAALHGAKLGAKVTLIENHKIGGTCLNYGCIPTKTLIEHSHLYHKMLTSSDMGIHSDHIHYNYTDILDRKDRIINELVNGITNKFKRAKINVINGHGSVISENTVKITTNDGSTQINADHIVLATGSKPLIPGIEGVDSAYVLTSKELLTRQSLPKNITIVGGGVIGMEFASLLNDFGVEVTVIEYAKTILPNVDSALGKRLKSICNKKGIHILTSSKVVKFKEENNAINTFYDSVLGEQFITSEIALIAIGRVGNFDIDMCNELGIQNNERFIITNEQYQTTMSNVYAIGDVNGHSLLAHAAYDQGVQLMNQLVTHCSIKKKVIPSCIFVSPEIGTVGLSEEEAKEQGIAYTTKKSLYSSSGKAIAMNENTGFVKLLVSDDGILIGVHILGTHASDLIHYGSLAISGKLSIEVLQEIIFAHPTLGELFSDAVKLYESI